MDYPRPTQKELEDMTEAELFERLLVDTANSSQIRKAINDLCAAKAFKFHRSVHELGPKPLSAAVPMAPDIRQLVQSATSTKADLESASLLELANTILNAGWDFRDPDPKGMNSDPEDVRNFLMDFSWRHKWWADLVEKGQRKWNTIIDAYGRWWLRQR